MTMYNSRQQSDDSGEFQEKVVQIRRVAKVVKGGRNLTFNAMVVVGDGHGHVGLGLGKGAAVPDAVRKGTTIAKNHMVSVALSGSTIPHAVTKSFGASNVLLRPAAPGSGIKAGSAVRAVMEAAGVRDIVTKALGSRNPINVVKAALAGLQSLQGELPDERETSRTASLPPAPDRKTPVRREDTPRNRERDRDRGPREPRGERPAPPAPMPAVVPPPAPPAAERPSDG